MTTAVTGETTKPERLEQWQRVLLHSMSRADVIQTIRTALRQRSDRPWSVRGGTGTAYGWITIGAPPSRCVSGDAMTPEDQAELGRLLGKPVHYQGESIPASHDYYRVALCRALYGHAGAFEAEPYWD